MQVLLYRYDFFVSMAPKYPGSESLSFGKGSLRVRLRRGFGLLLVWVRVTGGFGSLVVVVNDAGYDTPCGQGVQNSRKIINLKPRFNFKYGLHQ